MIEDHSDDLALVANPGIAARLGVRDTGVEEVSTRLFCTGSARRYVRLLEDRCGIVDDADVAHVGVVPIAAPR